MEYFNSHLVKDICISSSLASCLILPGTRLEKKVIGIFFAALITARHVTSRTYVTFCINLPELPPHICFVTHHDTAFPRLVKTPSQRHSDQTEVKTQFELLFRDHILFPLQRWLSHWVLWWTRIQDSHLELKNARPRTLQHGSNTQHCHSLMMGVWHRLHAAGGELTFS